MKKLLFSLLLILSSYSYSFAYHNTVTDNYAPKWFSPSAAVISSFDLVVPVRPVLKTPEGSQLKEKEVLVTSMNGTGSFLNSYLVTVAHITSQAMAGVHNQADQRTGQLFLWKLKLAPLSVVYINEKRDIAIFELPKKNFKFLSLAKEEPRKQELLWWICRGGLLENEWSVGRYLDTIKLPDAEGGERYFINPIIGGIHSGCSGAPLFNILGQVVGIVVSHNNAGSVLSVFAVPLPEIEKSFIFLDGKIGE